MSREPGIKSRVSRSTLYRHLVRSQERELRGVCRLTNAEELPFPTNLPTELGASTFEFFYITEACVLARTCKNVNTYIRVAFSRRRRRASKRACDRMTDMHFFTNVARVCPRVGEFWDERGECPIFFTFYAEYGRFVSLCSALSSGWTKHTTNLAVDYPTMGHVFDVLSCIFLSPQDQLPQLNTLSIDAYYDDLFEVPSSEALQAWSHVDNMEIRVNFCNHELLDPGLGSKTPNFERFRSLKKISFLLEYAEYYGAAEKQSAGKLALVAAKALPKWCECFEIRCKGSLAEMFHSRNALKTIEKSLRSRFGSVIVNKSYEYDYDCESIDMNAKYLLRQDLEVV